MALVFKIRSIQNTMLISRGIICFILLGGITSRGIENHISRTNRNLEIEVDAEKELNRVEEAVTQPSDGHHSTVKIVELTKRPQRKTHQKQEQTKNLQKENHIDIKNMKESFVCLHEKSDNCNKMTEFRVYPDSKDCKDVCLVIYISYTETDLVTKKSKVLEHEACLFENKTVSSAIPPPGNCKKIKRWNLID